MPRPPSVPRDLPGEAPFLAAILAEPDNDLPRLVFADWLEERGDPRGEFIRLQCRLEQLPLAAPERDDLEGREAELLARHAAEWRRAQGEKPGVVWDVPADNRRLRDPDMPFRRGFLEGARFASQSALERHFARLLAMSGLRGAHLPRYHTRLANLLANCPGLARVEQLVLGRADAMLQAVLDSPHCGPLRNLHLLGVTGLLAEESLRRVAESPHTANLRALAVHGSATDDVLSPLVEPGRLPQLESLDLGMRGFALGLELLTERAAASALTRLRLTEVVIGNRNARNSSLLFALNSPAARRLEVLSLCLLDWSGVATALAENAQSLVDLRLMAAVPPELGRAADVLSAADLAPLWLSPHLATLRRLDVSAPAAGDLLAVGLAESGLFGLRILRLECGLTDAGVEAILASPALRKLRVLRLPHDYRPGRALRQRLKNRFAGG